MNLILLLILLFIVALMVFSLTVRAHHYITFLILFAIVIVGQLQYFFGIASAPWLSYMLAGWLYVKLMGAKSSPQKVGSYLPSLLALMFISCSIGTIIHHPSPLQVLVSIKHYYIPWVVVIAFFLMRMPINYFIRFLINMLWLLPFQVPLLVYQRFFVANLRQDLAPWDAVVGFFGGDPAGGGASGAMALFGVFEILFSLSLNKNGVLNSRETLFFILCGLVSFVLGEVKIAIVCLPIGVALLFRNNIFTNPMRTVFFIGVTLLVSSIILYTYQRQYSYGSGSTLLNLFELGTAMITGKGMSIDFINSGGEVGRVAALHIWWSEGATSLINAFFGHGIGAVRVTNLVIGEVASHYWFNLGRSAMAVYLWETGIVGLSSLIILLLVASIESNKLASRIVDVRLVALLQAISSCMIIVILTLPYNTNMIYVPSFQFIVSLLVGFIILAKKC